MLLYLRFFLQRTLTVRGSCRSFHRGVAFCIVRWRTILRWHFRHLPLCHDETVVDPLLAHQLLVRSHLGKLAFIEHQNTCRIAQCGETVRDGKGRPIRDELLERILNLLFRLRVERSRRLIEDQNPRIVDV